MVKNDPKEANKAKISKTYHVKLVFRTWYSFFANSCSNKNKSGAPTIIARLTLAGQGFFTPCKT